MFHSLRKILPAAILAISPVVGLSASIPRNDLIGRAEQKVGQYLDSLADLHCTELVTQEKVAANGHADKTERAKYDYLIMMQGGKDDFQLNETRVAESGKDKPAKPSPVSMLVSNGISTALLIFHPYYRESFQFEVGAVEKTDAEELVPVHFEQIPGRRSPAALALRGREYPLSLKGTAWIDQASGDIVRIDAGLLNDMSDIGLRSLKVHVEYKPVTIGKTTSKVDLPAVAVVDVTTPRQRWRNTHVFEAYKSFSTDAEQDPNVKVHADKPADDNTNAPPATSPETKEKP